MTYTALTIKQKTVWSCSLLLLKTDLNLFDRQQWKRQRTCTQRWSDELPASVLELLPPPTVPPPAPRAPLSLRQQWKRRGRDSSPHPSQARNPPSRRVVAAKARHPRHQGQSILRTVKMWRYVAQIQGRFSIRRSTWKHRMPSACFLFRSDNVREKI